MFACVVVALIASLCYSSVYARGLVVSTRALGVQYCNVGNLNAPTDLHLDTVLDLDAYRRRSGGREFRTAGRRRAAKVRSNDEGLYT